MVGRYFNIGSNTIPYYILTGYYMKKMILKTFKLWEPSTKNHYKDICSFIQIYVTHYLIVLKSI